MILDPKERDYVELGGFRKSHLHYILNTIVYGVMDHRFMVNMHNVDFKTTSITLGIYNTLKEKI